jgi:hypothetical protein
MRRIPDPQEPSNNPLQQFELLADCLEKGLHTLAVRAVKPFPIGCWHTSDGRQILFDAGYHPIWQRHRDGSIELVNPSKWIDDILYDEFFFHEEYLSPLQQQHEGMKRLRGIVLDWERGQWQAKMRRLRERQMMEK